MCVFFFVFFFPLCSGHNGCQAFVCSSTDGGGGGHQWCDKCQVVVDGDAERAAAHRAWIKANNMTGIVFYCIVLICFDLF